MKRLRLFFAAFGSLPGLFVAGFVLACSFEFDDYASTVFFNPEIASSKYYSFYRSHDIFYDGFADPASNFRKINVDEWVSFFGYRVAPADVEKLLYATSLPEIDTLIFRLKDAKSRASASLLSNTILDAPDKNAAIAFLFYLGYAKRCEPYANRNPFDSHGYGNGEENTNGEEGEGADTAAIHKLIRGGTTLLKYVKYPFIAGRYYFQITRLHFFAEEYEACIGYYQALPKAGLHPTMNYRMLGYVAGAHYRLQHYAQANFLYAKIFAECRPMNTTAYLSFQPKEESDWRECFAFAQTPSERIALWAVFGIRNDPLRAMREIYAIDPQSRFLDLLLSRAVNTAEEGFIRIPDPLKPVDDGAAHTARAFLPSAVDTALVNFVVAVAGKENTASPASWCIAGGYLLSVRDRYENAMKLLARAEHLAASDPYLAAQVKKFRFIASVARADKLDASFERSFAGEFASVVHWDIPTYSDSLNIHPVIRWSERVLARLYQLQGKPVRAQCLYQSDPYRFYSDPDLKNAMLALMDAPSKTEYEKLLLEINEVKRSTMYEFDGIRLFLRDSVQQALDLFRQGGESATGSLPADPFMIRICDNHDRDHREFREKQESHKAVDVTKMEFVKKVLEIQHALKTRPTNASELLFQLGNAFYNVSYFGNSREFYTTRIFDPGHVVELKEWPDNEFLNAILDCSIAESYYTAACAASSDPEFKAKCLFMAAKCEQNRFFVSSSEGYVGDFKAGVYFHRLKNEFSKTQYYQEIIRECGYFRTFVSGE